MGKSKISWATESWDPVTGCTPVSEACKRCWARKLIEGRLSRFYPNGFKPTLHPEVLGEPLRWKKRRRVFVASKGDLFHPDVPFSYIAKVFDAMRGAHLRTAVGFDHVFIVLTKRPQLMLFFLSWYQTCPGSGWPYVFPHVYLGVSVENRRWLDERAAVLMQIRAHHRVISLEPLQERVDIRRYVDRLHWVVAGGTSGDKEAPWDDDWARGPRDACARYNVPFHFKQRSGHRPKQNPELDGVVWDDVPGIIEG